MRRIRVTLSYDGTEYHGWQAQPGLPTIQAAVEQAVSLIEGSPVRVAASGRTDAGVHALAQVAAFSLENPIPAANLVKALNRLLPRDIRVLEAAEAPADFHPRYQAAAKTYEYRILRAEICSPFARRYVYHHPYPLDERAMIELAPVYEGEHDFSCFAAADDRDQLNLSKVRRVFSSRIEKCEDCLIFRVRGSGFLKHMVRNMAGVLIEAGKGNLSAADLVARLQPGAKIAPGPSAPARGLFLVSVEYREPAPVPVTRAD
ncbi:MAG TPA: tRNA pseudouridine(38-40) synthase TruA [Bryobacteraceae bacterium]|jgi:tRNA pseudouridine38-40 synthase|nr:tRNA pseudouridine(38-40) synthase TruA [Bryobacteraceae bacterium]